MSSSRRPRWPFVVVLVLAALVGGPRLFPKDETSAITILRAVEEAVDSDYYDPGRIKPRAMLVKALQEFEANVDAFVAEAGPEGPMTVRMGADKLELDGKAEDLPAFTDGFAKVYGFIQERYKGETPIGDIFNRAVNAALSTLDPHTNYLPPKVFKDFESSMSGEFFGIGALIGAKKGRLTILEPIPNNPAWTAGIKKGDRILRIGPVSTENMLTEEAVSRIRGPKGTAVKLTVGRGEGEILDFEISRGLIKIPSAVSSRMDDGMAYVRLTEFAENSSAQLKEHVAKIAEKGPVKGLLLDLRRNSGGLLKQAIETADIFLTEGLIVATEGPNRERRKEERAQRQGDEPEYPIVVLVNQGSASAAEILAGALKLNGRAVIVGERTFGKGSVQTIRSDAEGFPGGGGLKLTISQYLLRNRTSIQSVGIAPDVELDRAFVTSREISLFDTPRMRREADLESHIDSEAAHFEAAPFTIRYYYPLKEKKEPEGEPKGEEEEEEEDEDLSVYSGEVDLTKDHSAKLALDVLKAAAKMGGDFRRERFLEEQAADLRAIAESESRKIEARLKEAGVDWEAGPQGSGPFEIRIKDLSPEGRFTAKGGEWFTLKATLTNKGADPAHRLFLRFKGGNGEEESILQGREVVFGKLGPGETKEAFLKAEISKGALARTDPIRALLCSPEKEGIAEFPFLFAIQGKPWPAFAFTTAIKDDGGMESKGDGDGRPEVGEKVAVILTVRNVGAGEAGSVTAGIYNKGGDEINLLRGREEFKSIGPGEEKTARFLFDVVSAPENGEIRLDAGVMDLAFSVYANRALKFPVPPPEGEAAAAAPAMDLPPRVSARLADGSDLSGLLTKEDGVEITGKAEDDQKIDRLFVMVNDDKVYVAGPGEGEDLSFSGVKVPLKKGALNTIRVVAKDGAGQREIATYLVRQAGDEKAKAQEKGDEGGSAKKD